MKTVVMLIIKNEVMGRKAVYATAVRIASS